MPGSYFTRHWIVSAESGVHWSGVQMEIQWRCYQMLGSMWWKHSSRRRIWQKLLQLHLLWSLWPLWSCVFWDDPPHSILDRYCFCRWSLVWPGLAGGFLPLTIPIDCGIKTVPVSIAPEGHLPFPISHWKIHLNSSDISKRFNKLAKISSACGFFKCILSHPVCCPIVARFLLL